MILEVIDLPPNIATVLIGLVPVLILLVKNNYDTQRIKRDAEKIKKETQSLNGTTLHEDIAKAKSDIGRLLNHAAITAKHTNRRHAENIIRFDTLEHNQEDMGERIGAIEDKFEELPCNEKRG